MIMNTHRPALLTVEAKVKDKERKAFSSSIFLHFFFFASEKVN